MSRYRCALADERGTMLAWMLVTSVLLVFLGGLSLDLWRGVAERRLLAGLVDAAAVAGSSAIDEQAFRDTGVVRLDPPLAQRRVHEYLAGHPHAEVLDEVRVVAGVDEVHVVATATLDLTLSRILLAGAGPLRVEAAAVAAPRMAS